MHQPVARYLPSDQVVLDRLVQSHAAHHVRVGRNRHDHDAIGHEMGLDVAEHRRQPVGANVLDEFPGRHHRESQRLRRLPAAAAHDAKRLRGVRREQILGMVAHSVRARTCE